MSKRLHLVLLALGVAAFAFIVARIGPMQLLADLHAAGWVLVPTVLVYAVVYLCSSEAWRLTVPERPPPLSAARAYAISTWAYALNYVTPMVSVGGEPFKIAAASQWLGRRAAAASVISQRLLHMQAHVLFFLAGVVLAWVKLPRSAVGTTALLALAAVLLLIVAVLGLAHRRGGVVALVDAVRRLPFVRHHHGWLDAKRPAAVEIDERITGFYHSSPRRYLLSLGLECLSRALSVVELVLIAYAIGVPVSYATAFLMTSFASLAVNALFFVPFALGAREGGFYVVFGLLGLPPELGVLTSVIGRLREIAWIALGLLLGLATRRATLSAAGDD